MTALLARLRGLFARRERCPAESAGWRCDRARGHDGAHRTSQLAEHWGVR